MNFVTLLLYMFGFKYEERSTDLKPKLYYYYLTNINPIFMNRFERQENHEDMIYQQKIINYAN